VLWLSISEDEELKWFLGVLNFEYLGNFYAGAHRFGAAGF
jgi:hypothetical protein